MRKRAIGLFCLVLLLMPLAAHANERVSEPRHAISMDPIFILFNMYLASYEFGLTDSIAVKASIMYTPNLFWLTNISYFDVIPEGRFYMGPLIRGLFSGASVDSNLLSKIFPSALNGPFIGVAPVVSSATINGGVLVDGLSSGEVAKAFGLGLNLTIGYKYSISNKQISFFAEPYAGIQLWSLIGGDNGWTYYDQNGSRMDKPEDFDDGSGRKVFVYGVNIGISF